MQQERPTHRLARRVALGIGLAEAGQFFLPKAVRSAEVLQTIERPIIFEKGDVIQTQDGQVSQVKEILRGTRPELVRYVVTPTWLGRRTGVIYRASPDVLTRIPLLTPSDRREDPLFVLIPGVNTDEETDTFIAVERALNEMSFGEEHIRKFFYPSKEMSMRNPLVNLESLSRGVYELKREFPLRPIILIGHSQGGYHAHELALLHYDSVVALISLDGALKGANTLMLDFVEGPFAEFFRKEAGKALVDRGNIPAIPALVEGETQFLQNKGVLCFTYASTDDSLTGDQYAYVETSDTEIDGKPLETRFPMGHFFQPHLADRINGLGALGVDRLIEAALQLKKNEGLVRTDWIAEMIEDLLQLQDIDEDTQRTVEEIIWELDRGPFSSHSAVLRHPKVLEGIKTIIQHTAKKKEGLQFYDGKQLDFFGLYPGKSTVVDMRRVFGHPLTETVVSGDRRVIRYQVPRFPNRDNVVYMFFIDQEKITAIGDWNIFKEDPLFDFSEILTRFGPPHPKTYSRHFPPQDHFYFPRNGFTVLKQDNNIVFSLYFIPQSPLDYLVYRARKDGGVLTQKPLTVDVLQNFQEILPYLQFLRRVAPDAYLLNFAPQQTSAFELQFPPYERFTTHFATPIEFTVKLLGNRLRAVANFESWLELIGITESVGASLRFRFI